MIHKLIRIKELRSREERRINSVKDLMEMFHLEDENSNRYQSIESSSIIDPKTKKVKALLEMFHLG